MSDKIIKEVSNVFELVKKLVEHLGLMRKIDVEVSRRDEMKLGILVGRPRLCEKDHKGYLSGLYNYV